ncbi:DUF6011 domain-containing protein [Streptomyces sp. TRM68367]|uniref:DUF6011 domain-containing protein n=1 Tax=Streptomyces sp. TRM68367 TaxID=2758415 RepID=UPI00165B4DB8|nr:DUF6011 domain-containing protein [Streptomyces sp. TRM68367]MBC9730709.1 hypothetical protein [Streptomyces sp. TRM68367]
MTATAAKTTAVKCKGGCGRTLTSAKSIALGYGPTCARKAGITPAPKKPAPTYRMWKERCGWCVQTEDGRGYYGLAYVSALAFADRFERQGLRRAVGLAT